MSKITPLMTALHMGHKAEERIKCIDNMLFKKCEDTKETILQAFWWYRKNSVPLDKIKQLREQMDEMSKYTSSIGGNIHYTQLNREEVLEMLDRLISEVEK